jgi:hypothetical protein
VRGVAVVAVAGLVGGALVAGAVGVGGAGVASGMAPSRVVQGAAVHGAAVQGAVQQGTAAQGAVQQGTVLGATQQAAQQAAAPPRVVEACVHRDTRYVRLVADCEPGWRPRTWAVRGPVGPGGPQGPAGPAGPPGTPAVLATVDLGGSRTTVRVPAAGGLAPLTRPAGLTVPAGGAAVRAWVVASLRAPGQRPVDVRLVACGRAGAAGAWTAGAGSLPVRLPAGGGAVAVPVAGTVPVGLPGGQQAAVCLASSGRAAAGRTVEVLGTSGWAMVTPTSPASSAAPSAVAPSTSAGPSSPR